MRYMTTLISVYPKTGEMIPGSVRTIRSEEPPPCDHEEGTTVEKFSGEPTPVFVHRSVATSSWHVDRGYIVVPRQQADYLVKRGHARLAKVSEMPVTE